MKTIQKSKTLYPQVININERFHKPISSNIRGNKAILTFLSSQYLKPNYAVYIGTKGDILVRPKNNVSIPKNEEWLHDPKIFKKLQKGITEVEEGKTTRVKDLKLFLSKL